MSEKASGWAMAWQPMVDTIGQDFSGDAPLRWGERIEVTAVARYLEPLELDCALHSDAAIAHEHGYPAIVVPYTAMTTLAMPLIWQPGDPPLFTSDARDARPDRSTITSPLTGLEPPTTHIFAVRWDMEFIHPALVGDRLAHRGLILKACTPKQTRVGRGAFIQWQSEIINDRGELLAISLNTVFRYNFLPEGGA
jgi:hypothetical protein